VLKVEPGREDEFEAVRAMLLASSALERLIASCDAEAPAPVVRPLPKSLAGDYCSPAREQARAVGRDLIPNP
jgi:hypothetical protein